MPALPLGDVLTEELDLDVPYGALVVVEEADPQSLGRTGQTMSYDLGGVVAETLLAVLRHGNFPLQQESDALYLMASAYHRMAEASHFQHQGLVPAAFRMGLGGGLGSYWTGTRGGRDDISGLFLTADFLECPRLRGYLQSIDAGFTGPDPQIVPKGLMRGAGSRHLDDWAGAVRARIDVALGAPAMAAQAGKRATLSRFKLF